MKRDTSYDNRDEEDFFEYRWNAGNIERDAALLLAMEGYSYLVEHYVAGRSGVMMKPGHTLSNGFIDVHRENNHYVVDRKSQSVGIFPKKGEKSIKFGMDHLVDLLE